MPRVLHINYTDYHGGGGCAIAMHRLHAGLQSAGVDSNILCWRKTTDDSNVVRIRRSRIARELEANLVVPSAKLGLQGLSAVSSFGLKTHKAVTGADILQLHGVWGNHFNYLALPGLSRRKPAILVLHDSRAYTGHCAFHYDCRRFVTGCGQCPYPDTYPPIQRDSTNLVWKLKKRGYNRSNLSVVALSEHQLEDVKQSLLKDFPIDLIHHGIDTRVFRPLDPAMCRHTLAVPPDKKVILFSALDLNAAQKGGDLLIRALAQIPDAEKSNLVLMTFGKINPKLTKECGIETINIGYVANEHFKAIIYSAADLFVSPTRAESFSLVTLESIACGTPVVAFDVGAIPEMIEHGVNGYIAAPEDTTDLNRGIMAFVHRKGGKEAIASNCERIVADRFTIAHQVNRYQALYQRLVNQPN